MLKSGYFEKGHLPWNKHKGAPIGTVVKFKFPDGARNMIKALITPMWIR